MFNSPELQIESKNLILLEDQMKREALAAKKSELYAEYFQDPELKSCALQLAKHHRNNFDSLMNYFNAHK